MPDLGVAVVDDHPVFRMGMAGLLDSLDGTAVRPSSLRHSFDSVLAGLFAEAHVDLPRTPIASGGGRRGQHSEYLGYLLTEMQVLARRHPGASW